MTLAWWGDLLLTALGALAAFLSIVLVLMGWVAFWRWLLR